MVSIASLGLILAIVAMACTRSQATCNCKEMCPSYAGYWEIRWSCPRMDYKNV